MTHDVVPPRELNEWERRILELLLSTDVPGVKELRNQLESIRVSEEYPDGDRSVIFIVDEQNIPPATVAHRIPVEAEGYDIDGALVQVLLHVIRGYLWELEVYRPDGEALLQVPEPSSLVVVGSDHASGT